MFKNTDLRFCAYSDTFTAHAIVFETAKGHIGRKFNPKAQNSVDDQQEYKKDQKMRQTSKRRKRIYEISMKSESTE